MFSLKTTGMDAAHPPDTHLSQLGYHYRCYLSHYVTNTFLRIFGLSHLNLFLTHSSAIDPSTLLQTLEQSEVRERVQNIRQLAQWIVGGVIALETLDWEYYLQPYLEVGSFLGVCDSEGVLGETEALEHFSVAFRTHIVVLEHTEKTLKGHLFLVEGEAPVIHMETFQGHFCSLVHQGFPLLASKDQLYERYSAYLEGQEMYLELILSQKRVIQGLLAVLKKEMNAEQVSALLHKSGSQARLLGLESEAYSQLAKDFGAYFGQKEAVMKPRRADLPPNMAGPNIGLLSPGHVSVSPGLAFPQAQKPLFDQGPAIPGMCTVPERKAPSQQPVRSQMAVAPNPKNTQGSRITVAEPVRLPVKAGSSAAATSSVKQPSVPPLLSPFKPSIPTVPSSPPKPNPIPAKRVSRPITTDRPPSIEVSPSSNCCHCHSSEYELYSDGNCALCKVCFRCAWKSSGICPKCHRQYGPEEISRFRLIMS